MTTVISNSSSETIKLSEKHSSSETLKFSEGDREASDDDHHQSWRQRANNNNNNNNHNNHNNNNIQPGYWEPLSTKRTLYRSQSSDWEEEFYQHQPCCSFCHGNHLESQGRCEGWAVEAQEMAESQVSPVIGGDDDRGMMGVQTS